MRMLITARFGREKFNAAVRDGSAGKKIGAILEAVKPEHVYFTATEGRRTAVMIVDMAKASDIPSIAEPFFLTFDADIEILPVMTPEDLQAGGLDQVGDRWG